MSEVKKKAESSKLPEFFGPVLWSYKLQNISPEKDKKEIIINTLNYGKWPHLQWIVNYYGKEGIQEVVRNIPKSEIRSSALALAQSLLGAGDPQYVSRGDKIRKQAGASGTE